MAISEGILQNERCISPIDRDIPISEILTHGNLNVSGLARWDVCIAASVQLAGADEAMCLLATGVKARCAHSEKTCIALTVGNGRAIVTRCTTVSSVTKVSLAPRAVELTGCTVSVAGLGECNLGVRRHGEDCFLTFCKLEHEECVTARTGQGPIRHRRVITILVPQRNLDVAGGCESKREVVATSIAVRQRKHVMAVRGANIANISVRLADVLWCGRTAK